MIVDHDKAGSELLNAAKKFTKASSFRYLYVTDNLYVLQIPKISKKQTEMEDLFEQVVLDAKLNGKKFNRNNNSADEKDCYGKTAFAVNVVKRHQDQISFENFKSILTTVREIIADYQQKNAPL